MSKWNLKPPVKWNNARKWAKNMTVTMAVVPLALQGGMVVGAVSPENLFTVRLPQNQVTLPLSSFFPDSTKFEITTDQPSVAKVATTEPGTVTTVTYGKQVDIGILSPGAATFTVTPLNGSNLTPKSFKLNVVNPGTDGKFDISDVAKMAGGLRSREDIKNVLGKVDQKQGNAKPVAMFQQPLVLTIGQTMELDPTTFFYDPEGGALSFAVSSDAPFIATAEISTAGKLIVRGGQTSGSTKLYLTATDIAGQSYTQPIDISVSSMSDQEAVDVAINALQVIYTGNDSASSVTQNVVLPPMGLNLTTVTWSSNKPEYISINPTTGLATVTCSVYNDVTVNLTATVWRNSAIGTKYFELNVQKAPLQVSEPLTANNITLINNYNSNDKVVVNGLASGDIVKVYSSEVSGTELGSAPAVGTVTGSTYRAEIVLAGTSLNAEVPGSVYVSVTNSGKAESQRVSKAYKPYGYRLNGDIYIGNADPSSVTVSVYQNGSAVTSAVYGQKGLTSYGFKEVTVGASTYGDPHKWVQYYFELPPEEGYEIQAQVGNQVFTKPVSTSNSELRDLQFGAFYMRHVGVLNDQSSATVTASTYTAPPGVAFGINFTNTKGPDGALLSGNVNLKVEIRSGIDLVDVIDRTQVFSSGNSSLSLTITNPGEYTLSFIINGHRNSTVLPINVVSPIVSTAPSVGNISVINNFEHDDRVVVKGLSSGDIVKVYTAATGGSLLGSALATVTAATYSAQVTLTGTSHNVEVPEELYISVTSPGKVESSRTEKAYRAYGYRIFGDMYIGNTDPNTVTASVYHQDGELVAKVGFNNITDTEYGTKGLTLNGSPNLHSTQWLRYWFDLPADPNYELRINLDGQTITRTVPNNNYIVNDPTYGAIRNQLILPINDLSSKNIASLPTDIEENTLFNLNFFNVKSPDGVLLNGSVYVHAIEYSGPSIVQEVVFVNGSGAMRIELPKGHHDLNIYIANQVGSLYVPVQVYSARAAAPTGISVTHENYAGDHDGTLTGVLPGQEYEFNGNGFWFPILGTTVKDLAPGTYRVRFKGTATSLPSQPTAAMEIVAGVTGESIQDLQVVGINDSQVTLSFSAPSGANRVLLQQKRYYDTKWSPAETTTVLNADSTTATVTGLVNGLDYSFRLIVNGGALEGSSNFLHNVKPAINYAPTVTGAVYFEMNPLDTLTLNLNEIFTDLDGINDIVDYQVLSYNSARLSVNENSGQLEITATDLSAGSTFVTIRAIDSKMASATVSLEIKPIQALQDLLAYRKLFAGSMLEINLDKEFGEGNVYSVQTLTANPFISAWKRSDEKTLVMEADPEFVAEVVAEDALIQVVAYNSATHTVKTDSMRISPYFGISFSSESETTLRFGEEDLDWPGPLAGWSVSGVEEFEIVDSSVTLEHDLGQGPGTIILQDTAVDPSIIYTIHMEASELYYELVFAADSLVEWIESDNEILSNGITRNLYLPDAIPDNEISQIQWVSSSHPEILSTSGTVNRPAFGSSNVTVRLTARLVIGDADFYKDIELTVVAAENKAPQANDNLVYDYKVSSITDSISIDLNQIFDDPEDENLTYTVFVTGGGSAQTDISATGILTLGSVSLFSSAFNLQVNVTATDTSLLSDQITFNLGKFSGMDDRNIPGASTLQFDLEEWLGDEETTYEYNVFFLNEPSGITHTVSGSLVTVSADHYVSEGTKLIMQVEAKDIENHLIKVDHIELTVVPDLAFSYNSQDFQSHVNLSALNSLGWGESFEDWFAEATVTGIGSASVMITAGMLLVSHSAVGTVTITMRNTESNPSQIYTLSFHSNNLLS